MWVWVNSGHWWWTGRPGVLQFMGSQRVGHDWATELTELNSAYKLNKQGVYIQPCLTPFPALSQSIYPCPVLSVASWPSYRFLRKVRWSGTSISKNFTQFFDLHSQRLWHSQWNRSRCFSGTPLPSLWSNDCWPFDLWFLCLFETQLVHLEFLGSHSAKA